MAKKAVTTPGPAYITRVEVIDEYVNRSAVLPYGLTVLQVKSAVAALYEFLQAANAFLVGRGYDRLEEMLLGNAFAGLLSEVLVKSVADHSTTLVRNRYVGGHPDLILRGEHADDAVLRASEGIEVKTSKQGGGWQGHNPEQGWLMIFRYVMDTRTIPVQNRRPTEVVEILAAKLDRDDWSFSGRKGTSRRTITASVNRSGMTKLRANPIYRHPEYVVGQRQT